MSLAPQDPIRTRADAFRRSAFVCSLGALLTTATSARAQALTSNRHEADAEFEQGKSALKRGDWDAACQRFKRSLELDPTPSTHVKVARCHEHVGALRAAWLEYERAIERIRARPARDRHGQQLERLVTTAMAELEPRLAILLVSLSTPIADVRLAVDGEAVELDAALAGLRLNPGDHVVEASAAGYRVEPVRVHFAEGEKRTVVMELQRSDPQPTPIPGASAAASVDSRSLVARAAPVTRSNGAARSHTPVGTPTTAALPRDQRAGDAQRWVGLTSAGLGAALFGAAGYFGIRTRMRVDDAREGGHCSAEYACDAVGMARIDDAKQLQTEALVFAAAGTVFAATGIVLWLAAPAERRQAHAVRQIEWRITPWETYLGGHF